MGERARMSTRSSSPSTTLQRLDAIAASLCLDLPGCKSAAVQAAEQRVEAARDARAILGEKIAASLQRDRSEDRAAPSAGTRELQAAQHRNVTAINTRKFELEETRVGFRRRVDEASEPAFREVDAALKEAAAIVSSAAGVLAAIEKFRSQNGIPAEPGHWRASRDVRHLIAVARELGS
jgi:hypothetical protein